MLLTDLGWDTFFETNFEPFKKQGLSTLRITRENRGQYIAYGESGEFQCELSGKYQFETDSKNELPTVGDWVAASIIASEAKGIIHALLPRKSYFGRKVAGQVTAIQIVASNIDTVFIITGLDENYNLRRIERYLTMAWDSAAMPVILLNKTDLCAESNQRKREVAAVAAGVDIYTLSAAKGTGMELFSKYLQRGQTAAFLGSSGVGKSTIINKLAGNNIMKINEVSELGSRGRHTTTFRELILLPNGGMVIDTPGMRELQVWGDEEGLKQVFNDIEELAGSCRFKDCSHESEPGCAVQEALHQGTIDPKRIENYFKLKKEFAYLAKRQTMSASAIEKEQKKPISKLIKSFYKDKLQ